MFPHAAQSHRSSVFAYTNINNNDEMKYVIYSK